MSLTFPEGRWALAPLLVAACSGLPACSGGIAPSEPEERTSPGPIATVVGPIENGDPATLTAVKRFFAPVIYQDIEDGSRADLLTRFTYDGNWKGSDQWENLEEYPQAAYVYTSIIEDPTRYFIHYGLYYPRDWCSLFCSAGQDFHESDMEGLTLTIDKRFATPSWPFGQLVTVQTRYHNTIRSYQNCSVEGGFTNYARPWWTVSSGCVPFVAGYDFTSPSPPVRVAVRGAPQNHATALLAPGDYPFPGGDGVVYFPTNHVAEVPLSTTSTTEVAYALLDLTEPELLGRSLWGQRREADIAGPYSTYEHDGQPVGPHDVY